MLQPDLLRTVAPAPVDVLGKRIVSVERLGKRIVFTFENGLHFVFQLMIVGRLRWTPAGAVPAKTGKIDAASFGSSSGSLVQRSVDAHNETNCCATCQMVGHPPADRSLSRFLRGDWPRTLQELEEKKRDARG